MKRNFENNSSRAKPNMNTNRFKTNFVPSKRVRMDDHDDRSYDSPHRPGSSNSSNYSRQNTGGNNYHQHHDSSGLSREKSISPKNQGFKELSDAIWQNYLDTSQTKECYNRKLELKEALDYIFRDIFPYIGIYIVGSSSNGFGTNESDVDICMMVSRDEINQKTEAIYLLKVLSRSLRKTDFIRNLRLISAKVPIIKFHDKINQIDCDLNINNHVGIRNTHLLKSYSELDWRVTPLVLITKKWAKHHDINDAAQQTVSSYNLTLMVIYFLQAQCRPPVLPVLHEMRPDLFNVNKDVTQLRLSDPPIQWSSENEQSLGELFLNFLEFYADFDFEDNIISVRKGRLISRKYLPAREVENEYTSWKYILIEEPFELTNTARSVYNGSVFAKILKVFEKSAGVLRRTRSLASLFKEKFYNASNNNDDSYYGNNSYQNNNNSNNNNYPYRKRSY